MGNIKLLGTQEACFLSVREEGPGTKIFEVSKR